MSMLQELLGQEDRFFELFEISATECRRSALALKNILQNAPGGQSLEEISASRRRDKTIHTRIGEELCSSAVTALEREDIMALGEALYKIPKTIEKIAERALLAPQFLAGFDLLSQAAMLEKATETLLAMIQELRQRAGVQKIKTFNDELQAIEGDADERVLELLRSLYGSEMEGRRVVYLKDLFELFETVTDRCRDAGNVVVHVVLKHS